MGAGAITGHLDLAQLVFATFVLFFFGLVLYLRREDKRDGYPMVDPAGGPSREGFPPMPGPKLLHLMEGGTTTMPQQEQEQPIEARRLFYFPGTALVPTGAQPLRDRIGPASYALRREEPMIYLDGEVQMLPLRDAPGWRVIDGDADPRGMTVVGRDGLAAGVVVDLWVDRSVKILRYLEVELPVAAQRVLVPIYYVDVKRRRREVRVDTITARHFAEIPPLRNPSRITAREEDQVNAFFSGATLFRHQNLGAA